MKMKKLITGTTILVMSTLLLAACGGGKDKDTKESSAASTEEVAKSEDKEEAPAEKIAGGDLQDGEYTLEEKNENNGYRAVFTMVVKDGKITESKYDNINAEGKSKTEDTEYNKMMDEKAGNSPEKFIPELNKALVEKQKPSEMDVVTGATHSTHSFQMYAEQLINAAEKGDTC